MGLIVLGLAFLFFLVVAYFAAKTWHVGHVVALTFLFLFTLLTLFMTATLFRTNKEYQPKYQRAATELVTEATKTDTLLYGSPADADGKDSVNGERTMAKVEQISRGRVWRNVVRVPGPLAQGIVLNMRFWNNDGCLRVGQEEDEISDDEIEPVPDDAADATAEGEEPIADAGGPAASSHGIREGQYVYAFKDFPIAKMTAEQKAHYFSSLGGEGEESFANMDKNGMCRVPIAYLGKFLVVSANDNAVTVQLQGQPDKGQIEQLENKVRWVLYERLPTDVSDLFGDADEKTIASIIPYQIFKMGGLLDLSENAYREMISEYARDGKQLTGRANDPFRVRVQVKFLQDYTQEVDLQVADGALPPADSPFNVQGLAQVKNMLQGEPTKFNKDDTAFFDGATAAQLQRQGIVEPVGEPIYSRPLRSFEYAISDYQKRFDAMSEDIRTVQNRVAELNASLKSLETQIEKHRIEMEQLQRDQEGFEAEKAELQKYKELLEERYEVLQGEVNTLAYARP